MIFFPCAAAAEWKFVPSIELKETYTDNLRLTASGTEKGDFVTEFSPGFKFSRQGRNLKVKADYVMQNLAYGKTTSEIATNHLLNADVNAEIVQDLLYWDGKASITQQNISPFAPLPTSNLNLTTNRSEVRAYSLSPYIRRQFGTTASAELRYSRDSVDSSQGALLSTKTDRVLMNLSSGKAFALLGWGLHFSDQKINYSNALPVEFQSASGNLSYQLTPQFKLTATAGFEKNTYVSISGEKPEASFWSAGFSWAPSERTSVIATAGKRFYGETRSFAASHRSRSTMWSINYSEDLTTTQSQFLVPVTIDTSAFLNQLWKTSIPDPEARQQVIDAYMRNTGLPNSLAEPVNTWSNRVFLQKSLQASVGINGVRNTLLLNLFENLREAQSAREIDRPLLGTNNLALDDRTRQYGANALWNWKMSSRTSANISASYSRSKGSSSLVESDNKSVRFALAKQFQPNLKGTVEARRIFQKSSLSGEIRENAAAVALSMGF